MRTISRVHGYSRLMAVGSKCKTFSSSIGQDDCVAGDLFEKDELMSIPMHRDTFLGNLGCLSSLCALLIAGCGPAGPREIPIEGKLTYGGGPFPKSGTIYFACMEPAPGSPNTSSSTNFGPDGDFQAKLYPGKYSVNLECWEVPISPEGNPGKSYLPDQWQSGAQSGFLIEVPADASGAVQVVQDIPKR